jgi:hypothetical protein
VLELYADVMINSVILDYIPAQLIHHRANLLVLWHPMSSGYERFNNRSSAGAGSVNRSRGNRPASGRRRR